MLHVLVPKVENDPEFRESLLGLQNGPFLSALPSAVQKWLGSSLWGKVYIGLVEANRAKFESGVFAPEDMSRVLPKLASEFRVSVNAGHFSNRTQIASKVQRLLDQLVDDLSQRKPPCDSRRPLSLRDLSNLVKTYWLHNALIASFTGLWCVREQAGDLTFDPHPLFLAGLKQASSAAWSDEQAYSAFDLINNELKSRLGPEQLLMAARAILDSFYLVDVRFLEINNRDFSSTPLTENALEIAKWLALVALDPQSSLSISEVSLARLELRLDALNQMIDHLKASPSPLDQGIYLADGKVYSRGIHIRHLARLYVDLIIRNPGSKNLTGGGNKRKSLDTVGLWFEQSYIKRFISESLLSADYLVSEGFKSKGQEESYDVDLVILDKVRTQIFLVQVKYHRRFR